MKTIRPLTIPVYLLVLAVTGFFLLPVLTLAGYIVTQQASSIASADDLLDAFRLTLTTATIATAIAFVLGTPVAYALARWSLPLRRVVQVIVQLPIVMPPAVAGLALLLAFGRNSAFGQTTGLQIPFTTTAVILAQVFVAAPFYLRLAESTFAQLSQAHLDAARVDGASWWQLYRYVIQPMALPGMVAGLSLCWARAVGEFGATLLFAGNLAGRTRTMSLLIYNIFERDTTAAAAAGLMLIGVSALALAFSLLLQARSDSGRYDA